MRYRIQRATLHLAIAAFIALATQATGQDWTRWGGPAGDFQLGAADLVETWPEEGPPVLWRRSISDHGHSAILHQEGVLYLYVRRGEENVLTALDAETGKTAWEQKRTAPVPEEYNRQFGPGPHATPLIAGERIFVIDSLTRLSAHAKADGAELWAHDLRAEMAAPLMGRGYGASPVAWNDLIIAVVGGENQGVVAFDQATGEIRWKALSGGGYVTPLIATIHGTEQLLVALGNLRAGLDPKTGRVLWELELRQEARTTMAPLMVVGDGLVFSSSAYADGSRVVEVQRDGDEWSAEEKWFSRKMQLMHQTAAQFDGRVYASSGDFGPTFLAALEVATGDLVFRQRGFAKANLMRVGDELLILDEEGTLALGRPSEEGIEVLAQAQVLEGTSWTAPTLVGTVLYVRNYDEVVALQLGDP